MCDWGESPIVTTSREDVDWSLVKRTSTPAQLWADSFTLPKDVS